MDLFCSCFHQKGGDGAKLAFLCETAKENVNNYLQKHVLCTTIPHASFPTASQAQVLHDMLTNAVRHGRNFPAPQHKTISKAWKYISEPLKYISKPLK
ncbi:MAG: hypothetical protein IJ615_06340 [Bacteroidaceae bacterium]|nr:hypothetical protein [Bacteroidaceae bacterium]